MKLWKARYWLREMRRRTRVFFAWFDLWVGLYWDTKKYILYLCPLPMLVISIDFGPPRLPLWSKHRLRIN